MSNEFEINSYFIVIWKVATEKWRYYDEMMYEKQGCSRCEKNRTAPQIILKNRAPHRKLFQKLRTAPHRSQNLLHRTAVRTAPRTSLMKNYNNTIHTISQNVDTFL